MSGQKTVHITEPPFYQIVKIERCGNCTSRSVATNIMYWYALNVSRMLTGRAENAASVRIFENAQALALVDV